MQQVVRFTALKERGDPVVKQQLDTQVERPPSVLQVVPFEDSGLEERKPFRELETRVTELSEKRLRLLSVRGPSLEREDQSLGLRAGEMETGPVLAGEGNGEEEHGAGADVNTVYGQFGPALHRVARNGNTGAVKALIAAGADVNATANSEFTDVQYQEPPP